MSGVTAMFLLVLLVAPAAGNWLPETRLTTAPHASNLSGNNARCLVAGEAGDLHLVWYDYRDGDSEIYYTRFNGVAWGPETALTNNETASEDPAIAIDSGGVIHVVWVDHIGGNPRVYHKAFDGVAWSAAMPVSDASIGCEGPSIAADALGRIHLVWRHYAGSWGVFYSMFDGLTWSESLKINDPAGYPDNACVACDDSQHVHVAWEDYRHLNWEIHYRRFNGAAWEPEARLTNDTAISNHPVVVADSEGNIQVFWSDNRDDLLVHDVYQKTYDGITWGADTKIVDGVEGALSPSVAAGPGGALHAVWYDSPGGGENIYYMAFDGTGWGAIESLTDVWPASKDPMVALDSGGLVHAVWHDARDGNYEIYWRAQSDLPRPEIAYISPDQAMTFTNVHITDLGGANFSGPVEVWLQKDGEQSIQANNETVVNAGKITCEIDLSAASLGLWDVVVQNVDLQRDTLFEAFSVIPLHPIQITSIDPDNAGAYENVHIDEISGQGLAIGAAVRLEMTGENSIEAANVSVYSDVSMSCDFILTAAEPGSWDVVVENPDGQIATLTGGFTVRPSPWGDDQRLTYDAAGSYLPKPNARAIAVDGQGDIHVVWSDLRNGNREIYYKFFDGDSWGPDRRITSADGYSTSPAIVVDSNNHPHVVWEDYRDGNWEIYYKYHDGTYWSADERVNDASAYARYPSLAIDTDDNLHLAWQDDRAETPQYVYYKMRVGSTWLDEHIVDEDAHTSGVPAIAVDGNGHVHIVWYQNTMYSELLLYRKFDGYTWDSTYVITDSRDAYGPTVAIDDSNWVHVAWHDNRHDNYEIFYRRCNGIEWSAEDRITDAAGVSSNASVAVDDSGYVHLVWSDDRDGEAQIYYSRNKGDGWGGQARLTNAPDQSARPSLALAPDGALHLIWRDYRDGNYEIYYKTRIYGELASIEDRLVNSGLIGNLRVVPNPFTLSTGSSTRIDFNLGSKARPVISVYDVAGRLVRRIGAGAMEPGRQSIVWDGTATSGGRVTQGIYFIEVSAAGHKASAKVIILH
jgi:hypothetical protein